ncbi:Smr/MutS family protein [Pontibaca methylaminivorans]|nr:Smr/MutS family protein [Pontibaca methylaminivorans]
MMARRLSQEELDLWRRITRATERLHPETSLPAVEAARPRPPLKAEPITPFRPGSRVPRPLPAVDLNQPMPERLKDAALQMDRKLHARMKRGKLVPEARMDLHGMTLARAHGALTSFILGAQASDRRLVLVITGKGKRSRDDGPIPTPRGVLRHQVPQWLMMPPLAQAVLQITPAHVSHGGEGAYYVYLRKRR